MRTIVPLLRIISEGETTTYDLAEGKVTLGRDDSNTVVLQDKAASSLHAHVLHTSDGWHIDDLQSTNGTSVNGKSIKNRRLRGGDRIKIGTTEIIFEDADAAVSEDGIAATSGFLQTILNAGSEDRA